MILIKIRLLFKRKVVIRKFINLIKFHINQSNKNMKLGITMMMKLKIRKIKNKIKK